MRNHLKRLFGRICRKVSGRPAYELPYWDCWQQSIQQRLFRRLPRPVHDITFVLPNPSRGWILEAICHQIARHLQLTYAFADDAENLPPARTYFFPHYGFLPPALRACPHVWAGHKVVFFTHPKLPDLGGREMVFALNQTTKILSMCTQFTNFLIDLGVRTRLVTTSIIGADPKIFTTHQRGGEGNVGLCTAFYDRKNPDRILEIVRGMPHRRFSLLGRNWSQYSRFTELTALPNFEYREADYVDYSAFYAGLNVFLSPAVLEGGPVPLLEAMMSNVVPVASRTGFAPDLIRHGENGFLFEIDSPVSEICKLIDMAYDMQADVRESVQHLTWERFASDVSRYIA